MKKRVLAALLSLVMLCALVPHTAVVAEAETAGAIELEGFSFDRYKATVRSDLCMILWCFAGRPASGTDSLNDYTDVDPDADYYQAVSWAVENDIIIGSTETTFNPSAEVTRAMMTNFVWRAMGSPDPTIDTADFTDVKNNAFYYKALLWAQENGVKSICYDENLFDPNSLADNAWTIALTALCHKKAAVSDNKIIFNDEVIWDKSVRYGYCGDNVTWELDTKTGELTVSGEGDLTSDTPNTWYQCNSYIKTATIGDGVTNIGERAFADCAGLTSVSIPDSVTNIGVSAFENCTGLTGIDFPDSVTSIGESAFSGCAGLTGIDIPDGVTSIGVRAFEGCAGLTSVSIPDGVTSIGAYTFSDCTGITSVNITSGITVIQYGAFDRCSSITDVFFEGSEEQWNSIDIDDSNTALTDAIIHFSIESHVHDWDEGVVTTPATCENAGVMTFTCKSDSSHTYTEEIDALGHDFGEWEVETSATCEGKGEEIRKCSRCPETESREITALGHDWGEWVYNDDATYEADGTKTRTCKNDPTHVETVTAEGTKLIKPEPEVKFADVADTAFYAEPVQWAVANSVTNGMSETTFAPNNKCTRAQVVTFLWRAAGCPEPTSSNNPFGDVKPSAYYYKAVLWAVENGVTSGMSATKFAPNNECTRGQVVTFLWRAKGKPAPAKTAHKFADVDAKGFYYSAMLWAVETGVTNGVSDTRFAPNNTCTRGQVVTFLYRAFN